MHCCRKVFISDGLECFLYLCYFCIFALKREQQLWILVTSGKDISVSVTILEEILERKQCHIHGEKFFFFFFFFCFVVFFFFLSFSTMIYSCKCAIIYVSKSLYYCTFCRTAEKLFRNSKSEEAMWHTRQTGTWWQHWSHIYCWGERVGGYDRATQY